MVLAALRPSGLTLGQRWLSVKHDVYEAVDGVKGRIQCAHGLAIKAAHACMRMP